MVPPTTTAMSPASAARSASTVRVVSATCAPDRMLKPDERDVLLQRDRHDVLDALADAGVDDLEPGVAQRAGDDLGAAVMAVEAGLGDEHSESASHQNTTGCSNSPQTAFSAPTISPTVQ